MKNLELEGFGLVEMGKEEMGSIDGGFIFLLALAVEVACYAAAGDILLNFKSYSKAIKEKTHGGAVGSW